jgi:hypothetical protein
MGRLPVADQTSSGFGPGDCLSAVPGQLSYVEVIVMADGRRRKGSPVTMCKLARCCSQQSVAVMGCGRHPGKPTLAWQHKLLDMGDGWSTARPSVDGA